MTEYRIDIDRIWDDGSECGLYRARGQQQIAVGQSEEEARTLLREKITRLRCQRIAEGC